MKYVLYILSIAVITMALIYVGSIKDRMLPVELTNKLYRKCRQKILDYLSSHECISASQARNLISDVTASVIWSRKRIGVTNPVRFGRYVLDRLVKEDKIKEDISQNKKVYRLK